MEAALAPPAAGAEPEAADDDRVNQAGKPGETMGDHESSPQSSKGYAASQSDPDVPRDAPTPPAAKPVDVDLDLEATSKLKMLRRLNPNKSQEELLAQIDAGKAQKSPGKQKRRWWWLSRKYGRTPASDSVA